MKKLYEASNAVEAYMIANLLENNGLHARVDGEYLQGGIGELPAGLVRVMVDEDDFDAAKSIIDAWDAQQPAAPASPRPERRGKVVAGFAAGLVVGIAGTWLAVGSPCAPPGWAGVGTFTASR